ncbi:MAG: transcriptional repressor [Gammaproteobacteria bacterium]|nr:transcriptional repressor [Gammaproteobacteria bacterium]
MHSEATRSSHHDPARLLADAQRLCQTRGLAFTPLRREVFELVCGHTNPVGAYELLDELRAVRDSAAPVTVYRALDFLVSAGLVHRVAALNAYTACQGHQPGHGGFLLVCGSCSNVIELEDAQLERSIAHSAAEARFETAPEPVEVRGICRACRSDDSGNAVA